MAAPVERRRTEIRPFTFRLLPLLFGLCAVSDYEYELQMALMNRRLEPRIETVFMIPAEVYSYVSSRLVKEVYQLGATIEGLVPPSVEARMFEKLKSRG